MTDRYYALTVVLERDTRTDDAEALVKAISMMRGVLSVDGEIADPGTHMATQRARSELIDQLWEVLKSKRNET